jgi:2-isopropylmalate synthase
VGVSANILDASWQALADGMRYALFHSAPEATIEPKVEDPSSA